MSTTSEVVRLRQKYDLEYQAGKRALEDPTIVAPHRYITKRMELMWEQMQDIERQVGLEKALHIVFGEHTDISEIQVQ